MSRRLKQIAKQITKSAWKKLQHVKKLAKSETPNLLPTLKEKYGAEIEDRSEGKVPVMRVVASVIRILDGLSASGPIVYDALHAHSLNTIVLYGGDEITAGCYEGGMADYEIDECKLYIGALRAIGEQPNDFSVGTGAHNVGTDFRTVMSHEMGHLVMQRVEDAVNEKFKITYDSQPPKYWADNVSTYAAQDDHELFAECFAAWTHPGYDDQLPQAIADIFNAAGIVSGKAQTYEKLTKAKKQSVDILLDDGTVITAGTIDEILDAVEDADWFSFEGDISPALMQAFKDAGYDELTTAGAGTDTTMFNTAAADAEQYAEEHSADLVTGITDSTRDMLRGTIEDAVQEGWDKDELAEEIENNYAFGDSRSELIASQELAMAYSKGRESAARDAGAEKKISLLSSDHDDEEDCSCSEAADAGEVDFDESFVEGDDDYMFAPYHVRCQCDWAGVYPEAGDDSDDDEEDEGDDEEHGKFAKGGPGSGPHPGQGKGKISDEDKKQFDKWMTWSSTALRNASSGSPFAKAVSKLPNFKGTIYRGMTLSRSQINSIKEGSTYRIDKFSSASKDSKIAEKYTRDVGRSSKESVMMEISVKAGKDISEHCFNKREKEVLLTKGMRFKITSVGQDKYGELTTIKMKQL